MKNVAALTMVYNEPEYLPIWCRYYGKAFGPENCFIIDHGSSDGSTENLLGFNVIRIPRSPKDNDKRTRFVSAFCNSLLEWYDGFLHTDVDEIVTHDPGKYSSLLEMVDSLSGEVFTAVGFDICHDQATESSLDLCSPITWQRRWMRFSSSMCKPVLAFRPISWAPGFHSADSKLLFAELYLMHLRYFDHDIGLKRLHRTRSMAWAHAEAGRHQRLDDKDFVELMVRTSRLPKVVDCDLAICKQPLLTYVERVVASEKDYRSNTYTIDLHIFGDELIEMPRRFVGLF